MATRYQRGNQKIEGLTIQWPQDTKGVIKRSKDWQYNGLDYSFGVLWPLYCQSFDLLITPLVSCGHCVVSPLIFWLPLWYLVAIVLSVLRSFNYPFGIFWPLYCQSFDLLITPLVSCGHCIVSPSIFYLPLWYPVAIVLSVLWSFDYPFGILWPLYCQSFDLLITPLVSFGHCIVSPSIFSLPLWYLVAILLSVLRSFIYPFVTVQWPKETKGVIERSKDWQHNGHKIPKG
jgi:hypothetical protein